MTSNIKDTSTLTTSLVNSQNNNVPFDELKLKIKRNIDMGGNKQNESKAHVKDMLAQSNMQNLFKSISTRIDHGNNSDADKIADIALNLQQVYADNDINIHNISRADLIAQIDTTIIEGLTPDQLNNAFKASGFVGNE